MVGTTDVAKPRGGAIEKAVLSSDCSLQLDCMKSRIASNRDQHVAVNTFRPCTHVRHTTSLVHQVGLWQPIGWIANGGIDDWGEVCGKKVAIGRTWLDHLLSKGNMFIQVDTYRLFLSLVLETAVAHPVLSTSWTQAFENHVGL